MLVTVIKKPVSLLDRLSAEDRDLTAIPEDNEQPYAKWSIIEVCLKVLFED